MDRLVWARYVRSSATIIRTVAHLSIPSQISSAQEEYDCLKVVQSQQIRDHQQRIKDATKVPPLQLMPTLSPTLPCQTLWS